MEEASTVWYVMDELGSRIGHSREEMNARLPNEKIVFQSRIQSNSTLLRSSWNELFCPLLHF